MLTNKIKSEIKEYSLSKLGEEICGLLIDTKNGIIFFKCGNASANKEEHCLLNPIDYIRASKSGKIIGHVHSQRNRRPSFTDYVNAVSHNIYSVIYSWKYDEFSLIEPKLKDYLNIEYRIGESDCFELVRGYYKNELNINISDYNRYDKWEFDMPNLITNNIVKEGFYIVDYKDIEKNDVIVFNILGYLSHLAVYMGNGFILHHPENNKSVICEISDALKKRMALVLRHKDFKNE